MTPVAALQAALSVEQAVVYGYGIAGGRLAGHALDLAHDAIVVHSERRDAIEALLHRVGLTPTPAPPAYRPPFPVTDRVTAAALAARLEDSSAGAAWDVAATSHAHDESRRLAVEWLSDAAVRAATWRRLSGGSPLPALPGQPG